MFTSARLAEHICCGCGLVESYLDDMNDAEKIKSKCKKVETAEQPSAVPGTDLKCK